MKQDFLEYYTSNLRLLRQHSTEFAAQFPKVAARLGLSEFYCQDPFVERLLEGTAFLAAHVERSIDDGYADFLQQLMVRLCPLTVVPVPALSVVSFGQQGQIDDFYELQDIDHYEVVSSVSAQPLTFSPLWSTRLRPVKLGEISFKPTLSDVLPGSVLESGNILAGLCFDLVNTSDLRLSDALRGGLDIYLNLGDQPASELAQLLQCHLVKVFAVGADFCRPLPRVRCAFKLARTGHTLLSKVLGALPGPAYLQLYMSYPELFRFITLENLGDDLEGLDARQVRIVCAFDRGLDLVKAVGRDSLRLNCVPLVNVFSRRSDRVPVSARREFHLDASHTAPLDYEVFAIDSLEIYDRNNHRQFQAYPFYSFSHEIHTQKEAVFFSVLRRPRLNGLYKKRSNYVKSEAFVALGGDNYASFQDNTVELAAQMWCTNADLPLFVPSGARFRSSAGLTPDAQPLTPLSRPQQPVALRAGIDDFTRLSYVMLNISALLFQDGHLALALLRNLIGAYCLRPATEQAMMIESLKRMDAHPAVFRFVRQGSVYFEQGFEVELELDEKRLAGIGLYSFGAMIRQVICDYSPLNVLVRFSLYGSEQGLIYTWNNDAG